MATRQRAWQTVPDILTAEKRAALLHQPDPRSLADSVAVPADPRQARRERRDLDRIRPRTYAAGDAK